MKVVTKYLVLTLLFFTTPAIAATTIPFTINLNEIVNVTGVPRIQMDVGGVTRYANYTSGSGGSSLVFTYTIVSGDVDADGVTLVSPIQLNGGTIKDISGNDAALTFIPPNTSGVIVNAAVPSGYTVALNADTVTNANKTALSFTLTYPKASKTLNYSIASSGGGVPITGMTSTAAGTTTVNSINVTTLPDGLLTLSVYVSDSVGGTGSTVTDTIPMAVLDNTLVGHWTFDAGDISGTTALDRSGQGNNGVLTNGPAQISGQVGGSLNFDGLNNYVQIPYSSALNPAQFSFSTWSRVTGGVGTDRSILTSRGELPYVGYIHYASIVNSQELWTGNSSGWDILTGNAISIGPWIHVVGTYDGSIYSIYENGVLVNSAAQTYVQNNSFPLRIGAGATEGSPLYFMNGQIDDVRIYNRALTPAEVTNIYNATN